MGGGLALGVFAVAFAAVIARQLVGRGPPVWLLLAAGALATVATGALAPDAAAQALSRAAPTLVFLLALFLFAPRWPPFVTLPACVLVFAALAALVGLVRRAEIDMLREAFSRRRRG